MKKKPVQALVLDCIRTAAPINTWSEIIRSLIDDHLSSIACVSAHFLQLPRFINKLYKVRPGGRQPLLQRMGFKNKFLRLNKNRRLMVGEGSE